jgi:phosphoglucomutase
MMLCEVASWYKKQGKTLWDGMVDLYETYGYYREGLCTKTLTGIDGAAQIAEMMRQSRENPPRELGGYQVLAVRDYQADTRTDLETGAVTKTGLPRSNVLYYELSDRAWCCVRPSGTEPKIKYYFGVRGASLSDADQRLAALRADLVAE